ncbi:MAG: HAMP domain-containing histidine kinase [Dehalococcoidia bacterium]|nr:HAMP domain-containing histidine kinase [Dehalococcoidia bacterium]
MRIPTLFKTIRFRLTLWYSGILIVLMMVLLVGINLAMVGNRSTFPEPPPSFPGDVPSWRQTLSDDRDRNLTNLRNYSLIGVGAILIVGAVGGYVISGMMLKPIDRVSSLAARISHTNLSERINHQGPHDEVKRLADTFDDMLQRLDSAFESQQRFIQDASHELKTPIATAQTNIEVLEMDQSPTVEDYKRTTEVVKRSLDRLDYLSQGLLLLSQGSHPKNTWTDVDLTSLIYEVVTEAQPAASSAEVSLQAADIPQGLKVKGDAIGIKQVVTNLVDNAIKYNRPEGSVQVSARIDGPSATIEVKDTGIGIAVTEQQRVFDRFYRVDKSRARSQGGSGLGLAIVKKVVEEHGGTVSVESTPGQGSTFRVALPLQK